MMIEETNLYLHYVVGSGRLFIKRLAVLRYLQRESWGLGPSYNKLGLCLAEATQASAEYKTRLVRLNMSYDL
jgi:hypothetical protein